MELFNIKTFNMVDNDLIQIHGKFPIFKSCSSFCIWNLQSIKWFFCPGCQRQYITKTKKCRITRLNERAKREDQPLHQHLTSCSDFNYLVQLFKKSETDVNGHLVDQKQHLTDAAINNTKLFIQLYVFNVWLK